MTSRVLIVAEAGVNHNGSIEIAERMVEAAADAGADGVKFQAFKAERLATATAETAEYQREAVGDEVSQREMLSRLELSAEDCRRLMSCCADHGVEFLCSAFDLQSVDMLASLGVRTWKVPSGGLTDLPYLERVGAQKGRVLLSTGMSTMSEVRAALDVLRDSGTPSSHVTVMHCTTEYPAPTEDVNMRAMVTMASELGVEVGYSDHTEGILAPVVAVALGASVVEKHVTLDREMPGPDHAASLEPADLARMVMSIRETSLLLGSAEKQPSAAELRNRDTVRKSIVAARAIEEGEEFTEANLASKRPGTGVSPMEWKTVVGRRATRDYEVDELIDRPD